MLGRGPARLCLHSVLLPGTFSGEAVPWDAPAHAALSGMSPHQLFGGHRAWVTPRETRRGQAGTAQPEVQLWLQDCAGLSGTKQLGQEGCRLVSLGCCCPVAPVDHFFCRSCSRRSAAGLRCLHQVDVLCSHTPSGFCTGFWVCKTSAQSLHEILPLGRMMRLSCYSCA